MRRSYLSLLLFSMIMIGCASPKVATIWKAAPSKKPVYDKILVVSIVKDEADSIRQTRETGFVKELNKIGYQAVSSYEMFGGTGLSGMSEESTYIKLCDNGIDAVLTLALINETDKAASTNQAYYTSAYYYNRIWNYSKIESQPATGDQRVWETILFDLALLEPGYVGRTKPFPVSSPYEDEKLAQWFISRLVKEKILIKGQQLTNIIKPF